MANIQCKMCGGVNEIQDGVTSGVCQYCGSLTTFPKFSDEQTEHLYSRAEHFRQKNDFDKAVSTYESILNRNSEDPEAYWGLVISRYGIEYVEDPATHERIPTCHRVQYESILADSDYQNALKYASGSDRDIYEKEANRIAEIQKGILRISAQEKPYDVFICYKETTEGGTRTKDSTLAQDIYYQLTNQGLKVFFSRITLEDKLGQQYEPYIFAALNSAKVMLVIGSKKEYFEAVWVKNEWSRFLALMKKDRSKLLIPCYRDMDAYDIPEELSLFQSQDMSKIGFIQDILRGIMKVVNAGKTEAKTAPVTASGGNTGTDKLMKRISVLLEQQDWNKAQETCEKGFDLDPENPKLYLMMCMASLHIPNEDALRNCTQDLSADRNFRTALKFASGEYRSRLEAIQQDSQVRFFLKKCAEDNHIQDVSQLFTSSAPLKNNPNFQSALKFASPERKKELLQIQYDQAESFLNDLLRKYNVSDLRMVNVSLASDPLFLQILDSASPERREELKDVPRQQCDYFLGKCLEANRVSSEADLAQSESLLAEDDNFKNALLFASPERKTELQQIQSKQTDSFLERCIRDNGVSSPEQSPEPITLDPWFNKALKNALPEQKKELLKIPDRQIQYFLDKCMVKHGVGNIDDLARCKTNLKDDPDFQTARKCCKAIVEDHEHEDPDQYSANTKLQKLDGILFEQELERRKPLIIRAVAVIIIVIAGICIFLFRYYIAAGLGSTGAAIHLAEKCWEEGDRDGSFKWYKKAAKQGNAEAQNCLGVCYEDGNGVTKDLSEAAKWYRKAADQGNAAAQCNLGLCYDKGEGVTKNLAEAVKWYRKAAEQGEARAQCNLALCYDKGEGVTKDYFEAVKWYRKAADQGNATAQCNLGFCYEKGNGVTKDLSEAVKWYRKAAEQGNADAQFSLGYCYDNGNGVTKNYYEAVKWYRMAADQGNAHAQCSLGICYENGRGVTKDLAEAVEWYRKAAEQEHAVAQFNLGICYEIGSGVTKDLDEAVRWYRKAAKQGYAAAQCNLGLCYDKGNGVTKDSAEAVRWFREAAVQGYAAAQCNLGDCYLIGNGVTKDQSKALKWYRQAADQGYADAQCMLGNCYKDGNGVTMDLSEAVKWYRKAAEQGNAEAQNCLGVRYFGGEGVTKDLSEAVKWYHKAAEQGNAAAQCNLGLCYEKGNGVTKDLSEAAKWYRKAAEQGITYAQNELGKCYFFGNGVTKNLAEAVKWFRKAANQSNADAQFSLGLCYNNGEGVTKDYFEAVKWFRKAADQGEARAQFSLGYCYENGNGVTKDLAEAMKWFRKAAAQDNADAQNELGECYFFGNGVTKDLSKAVKWYRMAAEQGNAAAQYSLGLCYDNGNGVTKDLDEAVRWYRKAAEQGSENAKAALERLEK